MKFLKVIIALIFVHFHVAAQRSGDLSRFYGSMNLGGGIVTGNIANPETVSSINFAMHLNIGYFVSRELQFGITLNGWLYEPYEPVFFYTKGESISNSLLHVQFYPLSHCRLFVKGAYGLSKYINLRPDGNHGNGNNLMFALGFEKELGKQGILYGVQLSYDTGRLKYSTFPGQAVFTHREFRVIEITVFLALD